MSEQMKTYLKDTAVKTVRTMAQTALGVIGSTALINEVNWFVVASATALSAVVCVLMSASNLPGKQ